MTKAKDGFARLVQHSCEQAELLKNGNGNLFSALEKDSAGYPILWTNSGSSIKALETLKGFGYEFLADLTAYDSKGLKEESLGRFVIVYNLFSPEHKTRIRLKTRIKDGEKVSTAVSLWAAANWAEREVYDMFGVQFEGHPDLRRILMDARWEGHPLRKDYPLRKYQLFNDPEPIPEKLMKE